MIQHNICCSRHTHNDIYICQTRNRTSKHGRMQTKHSLSWGHARKQAVCKTGLLPDWSERATICTHARGTGCNWHSAHACKPAHQEVPTNMESMLAATEQVSTPADRQVPLRWTRPLHLFWLPRYQLLGMGTCPLPCRVKFPPGHWAEIKMPSAAYTRMFSRIPLWRGRAGAKYFWHFVRYLNNQAAVAPEKRRHASHKLQIRPLLFKV